ATCGRRRSIAGRWSARWSVERWPGSDRVMMDRYPLELTVNGRRVRREVPGSRTLLEFLRTDLRLTGTNLACDTGDCGACTLLVDGRPVTSCLVLALDVDGCDVTTIEGLAARWHARSGDRSPSLHPVQQGFLEEGGAQCGFCTAGTIMA